MALTAGVSWVIAQRVESPDQIAARAAPPPPTPVVAAVREGYLNPPLSLAVVARFQTEVTLSPPATATGVVTFSGLQPSDVVRSGSVLLRINGRPVFVLPGPFPLYRDIRPGDSGDDVVAVQEGLRAAGYTIDDREGRFSSTTQAAIAALYDQAGFEAPSVPVDAVDGIPDAAEAPQILLSEFIIAPLLPAEVQSIVRTGAVVSPDVALATLGSGGTIVTATVPPESIGSLVVGATGSLIDESGSSVPARLDSSSLNADGTESQLTFSVSGNVVAAQPYVVTMPNPAAEPGTSLLVPTAAVVSRGDQSYLYVSSDNQFLEVEIRVIDVLAGVAAIAPLGTGVQLRAGSLVRLG